MEVSSAEAGLPESHIYRIAVMLIHIASTLQTAMDSKAKKNVKY